jgi:DNA-binding HxlR family transcriptional regulator
MTPSSAKQSNAAARDAGWFSTTWRHVTPGKVATPRRTKGTGRPRAQLPETIARRRVVLDIIAQGSTTRTDIMDALPDVSKTTIDNDLFRMSQESLITSRIASTAKGLRRVYAITDAGLEAMK